MNLVRVELCILIPLHQYYTNITSQYELHHLSLKNKNLVSYFLCSNLYSINCDIIIIYLFFVFLFFFFF